MNELIKELEEFVSKLDKQWSCVEGAYLIPDLQDMVDRYKEKASKPVASEMEKRVKNLKDVLDIQVLESSAKTDEYMRGMANGLLLAMSCFDDKNPEYIKQVKPVASEDEGLRAYLKNEIRLFKEHGVRGPFQDGIIYAHEHTLNELHSRYSPAPKFVDKDLVEELAELEHDQWMRIRQSTFNKAKEIEPGVYLIEKLQASVWKGMLKPYSELSEELKEYDRIEARKALEILSRYEVKNK